LQCFAPRFFFFITPNETSLFACHAGTPGCAVTVTVRSRDRRTVTAKLPVTGPRCLIQITVFITELEFVTVTRLPGRRRVRASPDDARLGEPGPGRRPERLRRRASESGGLRNSSLVTDSRRPSHGHWHPTASRSRPGRHGDRAFTVTVTVLPGRTSRGLLN
jgi:hypothetical protein